MVYFMFNKTKTIYQNNLSKQFKHIAPTYIVIKWAFLHISPTLLKTT